MKEQVRARVFGLAALAIFAACPAVFAQNPACASGYRVVARRYDSELRKTWELRQNCDHPEWPARSVMVTAETSLLTAPSPSVPATISTVQPVLVHAGKPVRLWSQDAFSRIELTGIAEQSARLGERINVRIEHQTDNSGIAIQHIAGIVRAANDMEIAQ